MSQSSLNVKIDKAVLLLQKMFRNTWIHRSGMLNPVYKNVLRFRTRNSSQAYLLEFREIPLYCDRSDLAILPSLLNESFEKIEIDFVKKIVQFYPDTTYFIDVGANIGVYSLIVNREIAGKSKIIAFEPDPRNFKLLKINIGLNSVERIEAVRSAVGQDGIVSLLISQSGALTRVHSNQLISENMVPSVSIDTLHSKGLFEGNYNFILKIDVEGLEPTVLRNSMKFIVEKKPTILFEVAFTKQRLQIDNWDNILETLIEMYKYAIVISGNSVSQINKQDGLKLKSDPKLKTMMLTDLDSSQFSSADH